MKYEVGKGLDEYVSKLGDLVFVGETLVGRAIYQGADIVADAVKESINALPKEACSSIQKTGLQKGFGIARMRNDNGLLNVKIGFAGYNVIKTKTWPKGQPNAMIARSIESGTSWKSKHPFIAPAVRKAKAQAEAAMQKELDKDIKKIMG